MALSITAFSVMIYTQFNAISIMKLSITILRVKTFSIITLSMTTLSIKTFSIATLGKTLKNEALS